MDVRTSMHVYKSRILHGMLIHMTLIYKGRVCVAELVENLSVHIAQDICIKRSNSRQTFPHLLLCPYRHLIGY